MPFEPEKITRANVLEAVQRIESQKLVLKPSTVFDVIINNKPYPPKEIMRHAHSVMNGELKWLLSGGGATNKYLKDFGFEVVKKGTQADPVREVIERYKKHIHATQFADESYKWVLINKMQGKPDLKAQDFFAEIKRMEYKNLVYPMAIAVLLHITKERAEQVRQCFIKLFDDETDLEQRTKTFSEETLALYRGMGKTENHHQDERSMATYLTFYNPDRYMLFKTTVYDHFCDLLKVEKRKSKEKYAHYLELLDDFIDNYVAEDEELIGLKDQYLPKDRFDDKDHRLLAQDILYQMLDKAERLARKTEKRYWRIGTSDNQGTSYWSEMKKNRYASIGWADLGDLTSEDIEKKDIIEMMNEAGYYDGNKSTISRKAGEVYNFLTVIKPGDVILAQDGSTVLGVGLVEDSEIRYEANQEFPNNRAVDWKVIEPKDFSSSDGNMTTVYEVTDKNTIAKANELLGLSTSSSQLVSSSMSISNQSKNTILFGPPGTGKTFNSINHALAIIENKSIDDISEESREEVKSRFDFYQKSGRIVFSTFHQSMSYEDFIEGIKPETIEEQVVYEVKDGIFKTLSTEASFSIAQGIKNDTKDRALIFSDLYDQFVDSVEKTMSFPGSYGEVPTKSGGKIKIEGISAQGNIIVKHPDGTRTYTVSKQRLTELDRNLGDLEKISNVNTAIREVIGGSNSSAYYALLKVIRSLQPATQQQQRTYSLDDKIEAVKTLNAEDFRKSSGVPYVIIIDEINRGNISQIFGELITLIEDDKRLGNTEALEVTLPYSKEKFGVPPNVYIIGTMNTADRSVEALDAALRRRFSFKEILPEPSLITTQGKLKSKLGKIEGIDMAELLTTINIRIEKLLDKDHLIGHSYFMNVADLGDLKVAFQNKINPLLQEYFYGDFGKIGLVLGTAFFQENTLKTDQDNSVFAEFPEYETSDLMDRKVYRLQDVTQISDDSFKAAIAKLLRK